MPQKSIDQLAKQLALGKLSEQTRAFLQIWKLAKKQGVQPASINKLYLRRGEGKIPADFTVPAINIRGMTYDVAQTIFKSASNHKVGTVIFELARSEMGYTNQPPHEYAGIILAAAIKQNYHYPVFIQGDHFHFRLPNKKTFQQNFQQSEMAAIKKLSLAAIDAGFYNIDIDASTLVDYNQSEIKKQQKANYAATAELANFIRKHQPQEIQISLGGEIGHIGGKNSTKEELRAFIQGFEENLTLKQTGLSKISIQTGTHHGGVVLPDGSLAEVAVDFETIAALSQEAKKHGLGGVVQHGASTLPEEYFAQFPQAGTLEIHLATEFQNIIFDHPAFPQDLLQQMHQWLDREKAKQRKSNQTDEQFYYEFRKTAWGAFKEEIWYLPQSVKQDLLTTLTNKIDFLFNALNVVNTRKIVDEIVQPVVPDKTKVQVKKEQPALTPADSAGSDPD